MLGLYNCGIHSMIAVVWAPVTELICRKKFFSLYSTSHLFIIRVVEEGLEHLVLLHRYIYIHILVEQLSPWVSPTAAQYSTSHLEYLVLLHSTAPLTLSISYCCTVQHLSPWVSRTAAQYIASVAGQCWPEGPPLVAHAWCGPTPAELITRLFSYSIE